jgi:uncharacterized protein
MANPLLDRASPKELANRGQVIEITEKIGSLGRLSEIVNEDLDRLPREQRPRAWQTAPVTIRLRFGWADDRRALPAVTGSVDTTMAAVCQRCLEPFELPVQTSLNALLTSADEPAGHEDFEVWELDEDTVCPLDLVEEALIMALPLSAMHPPGAACSSPAASGDEAQEKTVRPFANLRQILNDTND